MHLPKLHLYAKFLWYLFFISTLPLFFINYFWYTSTRDQIVQGTTSKLEQEVQDVSTIIQQYIETKTIGLIIHAQTDSILEGNITKTTSELQHFLLQDADINELSVIDKTGKEILRMNRSTIYPASQLTDQSQSPAFRIPTFVGGERYVGPITVDEIGNEHIHIAVPIVKPEQQQQLLQLSTSSSGQSRASGQILGVLKADISVNQLLSSIVSRTIAQRGYLMIVDDKGTVLAHPNKQHVLAKQNFKGIKPVDHFLQTLTNGASNQVANQSYFNEKGEPSFSNFSIVPATNWGIIAQVPVGDVLQETNQITQFIFILLLTLVIIILLTSLVIARKTVAPIEQLQEGVRRFGLGFFHQRINVKTGDEIEELGQSFNNMAERLEYAFEQLKEDKNILSAERNKLAVILSGVRDAVIATDLSRTIILFNSAAEQLTNYKADEAIGRSITEVIKVFKDDKELNVEQYAPIRYDEFEGVTFSEQELRLVSKKETYVQFVAGKIREGAESNLGCIITIHDMSQERQLEAMKLDFVSMAAHELRTPLTSVRGYGQLLKKNVYDCLDSEHKEYLQRLIISTENLSNLIDNLLNVSRIEKGSFTVELSPLSLSEIIEKSMAVLKPQANSKQQQFEFLQHDQQFPLVYADSFRLTQVVNNLVANAINYTPEGGRITIAVNDLRQASNPSPFLAVSVKDTGQGIPKEALPHLFNKFFRVSGSLEQGSKGTGLGLFISKSIITMHHGDIWVESTLGEGSTFTFTIPIATSDQIAEYERKKETNSTSLFSNHPGLMMNPKRYKK